MSPSIGIKYVYSCDSKMYRHLEIVEEFFMKPIKEGRIGGSTSSNAFTHTDYVKVNAIFNDF